MWSRFKATDFICSHPYALLALIFLGFSAYTFAIRMWAYGGFFGASAILLAAVASCKSVQPDQVDTDDDLDAVTVHPIL